MTLGIGSAAAPAQVDEHAGVGAMSALAGEWAELFARCALAAPFQHPAWTLAWARHLAGGRPFALAVRHEGRLAALAAFALRRDGVVELAGAPITDYRDALVAGDAPPDAAWTLIDGALRRAPAGTVELADLPAWSPLIGAPAPDGIADALERCAVCPVVTLARGAALRDVMSARLAEDLERFERRLVRRGRLAVRSTRTDDHADDYADAIDRLIALHAARWRSRGGAGVLADAAVQAHHREVARGFAAAGMLALTTLTLDDEPVATVYGFRRGARFYSYLSGFSPSLARFSIGSIALRAALERAHAAGAREIDFLRGAEPYKYRWGARDRPTLRRTLRTRRACAG